MEFKINAGTLAVGALLFILAVFVKPLVMILRDKAVWWWIDWKLINRGLYEDIDRYAIEYHLYLHAYRHITYMSFEEDADTGKYVLKDDIRGDGLPVVITNEQRESIWDSYQKEFQWHSRKEIELKKKSNTFDLLMRYYDQGKPNPIDKYVKESLEKVEEGGELHMNEVDSILYVVSELMTNPSDWRIDRKLKRHGSKGLAEFQ